MRASAVMFDWDGVLIDSLGASFNVYNKIFARLGVRQLTNDEFLEYQSPNWYDFYQKVGLPERLWKEADDDWVKLYDEERPVLHPDALSCLTALKDQRFSLALVSNGSKDRISLELKRFRVRSFFDSVEFGTTKERLKPSPFMLEKTLVALGLKPEHAVYVGDSPADIQAARNAGVVSIALARGPIQAARLRTEGPDHLFRGLEEMTAFLTNGPTSSSR
ncbi:MAG: HAD family hydrolase [Nitrososphaerota archaeon]|nr:HAD family hydrolase [Nitrososphaerota archaeon]